MSVETKPATASNAKAATVALVLLTALNLVNYIDRYILPGVQEMVKSEFHVSDERIGALTMWFFVTYIVTAPLTGWLGDHFPRKPLIVIGALLWSGTNLFTAMVHDFDGLLVRHAALGIGEASFGIYAPALLADFYGPEARNRALTIFNIAIPVGAAMGYGAGAYIAQAHGWRNAFYVSAIPGLVIAVIILFVMKEPKRGETDSARKGKSKAAVADLIRNPAYLTATMGYAMSTFTIGGISAWIPSFLQREAGMTAAHAGFTVGAITAVTGLLGTAIGGWWAQRWLRTDHRALYWVCAIGPAICVPFALLCFFGPRATMLPALAIAELALFLGSGPVNAAIVNSVSAQVRSTALAGQLLLIHLFGDVPSPRIIGFVSDRSNLRWGLGVTVFALVASSLFQWFGSRYAPEDSGVKAVAV
ncbi:arabinose efflux permease family protein [Terriglobus roseus DSM 18391]|uniref:Arabinose efflux permease family protein n=1 Tax=Terriglobus roseus (strain DSM 18391 / NRRL B-41598 / KBS 63) TaxID=926566 RepID=I3ZDU2_TERRK|nr:MFS transporter [Terriglobus roseus]AFL87410.1 arabinose efflux permease family protein [Terriglobus roseus DSM 18391]